VISVPTMRAALRAPGPFGCAVLDVNLDTDSGIDLGRALLESGATVNLVFFSGSADEATRHAAEGLGAFVNKADDFMVLLKAVEHCFGPESGYSGVSEIQPDAANESSLETAPSTPRSLATSRY
jgi:FixJ family two-component response regulator